MKNERAVSVAAEAFRSGRPPAPGAFSHHVQRWRELLWRFFKAWWKVDRIRIEATAGRMATLSVDERVLLFDEIWTVVSREVAAGESAAIATCVLTNMENIARLVVTIRPGGQPRCVPLATAYLCQSGNRRIVWDSDISILSSRVRG